MAVRRRKSNKPSPSQHRHAEDRDKLKQAFHYKKSVYFVGAGMSTSVGAPANKDFMEKLIDFAPVSSTRRLRLFLEKRYGSIKRIKKVNIETLLSKLDEALAKGNRLSGYDVTAIRRIRTELVNGIALTLSRVHYDMLGKYYGYHRDEDPYYYEARDFKILECIKGGLRGKPTSRQHMEIEKERGKLREASELGEKRFLFKKTLEILTGQDLTYTSRDDHKVFLRRQIVTDYWTVAAMARGLPSFREWFCRLHPLYPYILGMDNYAGDPFLKIEARNFGEEIRKLFVEWLRWLLSQPGFDEGFREDMKAVLDRVSEFSREALVDEYLSLINNAYSQLLKDDEWVREQARYLLQGRINPYTLLVALLGPDDSLITTNYDLFLETVIRSTLAYSAGTIGIDYHINDLIWITPWGEHGQPFYSPPLEEKNIPLLKLHGSINLLRCPACGRLYFTLDTPAVVPAVKYTLEECAKWLWEKQMTHPCCYLFRPDRAEIPLIPPTLKKSLSVGYLAKIWERARLEIACASELVFIGYALSESDKHIRELIRSAISLRSSGKANDYVIERLMEVAQRESAKKNKKAISEALKIDLRSLPLRVTLVCGEADDTAKRYEEFFTQLGIHIENTKKRDSEYLIESFLELPLDRQAQFLH